MTIIQEQETRIQKLWKCTLNHTNRKYIHTVKWDLWCYQKLLLILINNDNTNDDNNYYVILFSNYLTTHKKTRNFSLNGDEELRDGKEEEVYTIQFVRKRESWMIEVY